MMAVVRSSPLLLLSPALALNESNKIPTSSSSSSSTANCPGSSCCLGFGNGLLLRTHNGCSGIFRVTGDRKKNARVIIGVRAAVGPNGEDGSPSSGSGSGPGRGRGSSGSDGRGVADEIKREKDRTTGRRDSSLTASSSSPSPSTSNSSLKEESSKQLRLDDVNPVGLGRKARQLYDDVWKRLTELGQLTRSYDDEMEDVLVGGAMCDFTTPNAELTTILVAGATSRVGRVLIRKLQIRGYKVKALVRNNDPATLELLPRSVQIIIGELGDPVSLKAAVEGCNKIICCATARSDVTGDLLRVDNRGVYNLSKAFQDFNHRMAQTRAGRSSKSKLTLAKFSTAEQMEGWDLGEGTYFKDEVAVKYDGGMDAQLEIEEEGKAVYSGYVFTRGGYVELWKTIALPPGLTLDRYEGLVLSVCGDGKFYSLVLKTSAGEDKSQTRQYYSRFPTRIGYSRVRIPFSTFRPMREQDPPLDPFYVHTLAIRFEPRRQRVPPIARPPVNGAAAAEPKDQSSFKLTLDYIKALPGGEETDFILVSCAGAGIEPAKREKLVKAKQAGEAALRNSGLGYTIIRPGPLQEEPGGQKALIFDQGDRISQAISCADVADVCVKALHDPTARNKSFDVSYEYSTEEGVGLYELVAHLPDKSNNYLTPALSVLEKNT